MAYNAEKILTGFIVLTVVIALFSLFYVSKSLFFPDEREVSGQVRQKQGSASFTSFDIELAKTFMDKNNDGKCDVCGMDVNLCIKTGQLQCNMGGNSQIGILDSQHVHADWKVYINGKQLDFSDKSHMDRMRNNLPVSSFIHVDSDAPAPEKTGDILHMHATGVPLWIFFESIGMNLNEDCITLENKEQYCSDADKKLKFYVNGKLNDEFENYVFKDMDKILVSYGDGSEEEIKQQLASITDFAGRH